MKITSAITVLSVLVVQQVVVASSGKALGKAAKKLIEPSGVLSIPSRLFTDTTGKANKSTKKARNLQSKAIKGAETGTYLSISTLSLPSVEEDGVEDDRGIMNEPSLNLSEKLSNDEPAYGYHVLQPKTTKTKATFSRRNLSGKAVEALSFPLDVNGSLLLDEDVAGGYHVFHMAKTPKGGKEVASRKLGKAENESYFSLRSSEDGHDSLSVPYVVFSDAKAEKESVVFTDGKTTKLTASPTVSQKPSLNPSVSSHPSEVPSISAEPSLQPSVSSRPTKVGSKAGGRKLGKAEKESYGEFP